MEEYNISIKDYRSLPTWYFSDNHVSCGHTANLARVSLKVKTLFKQIIALEALDLAFTLAFYFL